jgi:hypothetical protein
MKTVNRAALRLAQTLALSSSLQPAPTLPLSLALTLTLTLFLNTVKKGSVPFLKRLIVGRDREV